ncbi:hypothetical protein acdb102_04510 [Acidothermaceae bacterium B102]|nr:hypothetical protein acdb102_04510 [Acidothermaceae bacterium B102]
MLSVNGMKERVLKQSRVGTVLSARVRSCTSCGDGQIHSLVRSGVRRWLRWGPPAYCLDQFAMCNACLTRQPLDGWFDGPTEPVTLPLSVVLPEYETAGLLLQEA